jgi:hypothetical protein
MPDDLATLETQRSKLLEKFLGLGDLRTSIVLCHRFKTLPFQLSAVS